MALIKCSECGKEISNKATNCIHCGCPIEKYANKIKKIIDVIQRIVIWGTILTIIFGLLYYIFSY